MQRCTIPPYPATITSMSYAIEIKQLCKTYGTDTVAVQNMDLTVQAGDFFGLLGPNGAGKSTTIGIITSLVNKTSGSIKVFGHDLATETSTVKSLIGLVPQEFNFNPHEQPYKILQHQAGYYGISSRKAKPQVEWALKTLGLWDKRHARASSLSGGMKRRLLIARGLVHQPKLLILDEPTAGVDIELRRFLWQFLQDLNAKGTTIILTTHYLEEAESLCRNIAIIDHGKLITNTSKSALLTQLDFESFVLYLKEPLAAPPELDDYKPVLIDSTTLEVTLCKQQELNQLFAALEAKGIAVDSMKNKSNRLEELFLHLTEAST